MRFLKVIDAINEWVGKIAWFLLPFLMVAVVYEVVVRYVFNRPTIWAFELNQFLFCAIIALGGGWALLRGGHVNVDVLYGRFGVKNRAIISVITAPLVFLFTVILLLEFGEMAVDAVVIRERSDSLWAPPVFPIKVIALVGIFCFLIQCFAKIVRDFITALTGRAEAEKYVGSFERRER